MIDEVDVHLHPRWEDWVVAALKKLIQDQPGLTLIVSAHSVDIVKAFRVELEEPGLRKKAHMIMDGMESPQ